VRTDRGLVWTGRLRPTSLSDTYTVESSTGDGITTGMDQAAQIAGEA